MPTYTLQFTVSAAEPVEWALDDITTEIGYRGYNAGPHVNHVRGDVRGDAPRLEFTVTQED